MPILRAETSLYPENLLSDYATENPTGNWWTVYTKPRQEKAFARQLVELQIPFYLPLVPKDNIIRGRRIRSHIPIFGGYIFLFGTREERSKSMTTNRISTILEVEDQPLLLKDLNNLSTLIGADAPLTVERRLTSGDPVRVKNGPMAGMEGVVVQRRGKSKLLVAVTMLQQGVSVELDDCILEPL